MVALLCNRIVVVVVVSFFSRGITSIINVYFHDMVFEILFIMHVCVAKEGNHVRLAVKKTYDLYFCFGCLCWGFPSKDFGHLIVAGIGVTIAVSDPTFVYARLTLIATIV